MTRRILYMAHPMRGDVSGNIARALRWLRFLRNAAPGVIFDASWIAHILSGADDNDPVQRQAGLDGATTLIRRLDGVVCVGGRISDGINIECARSRFVYDLTSLGDEPPIATPERHEILFIAQENPGVAQEARANVSNQLRIAWGPGLGAGAAT